jgi:hypothetical protein
VELDGEIKEETVKTGPELGMKNQEAWMNSVNVENCFSI